MEPFLAGLRAAETALRPVLQQVSVIGAGRARFLFLKHGGRTGELYDLFDEGRGWRLILWDNPGLDYTPPDREVDVDDIPEAVRVIRDWFGV